MNATAIARSDFLYKSLPNIPELQARLFLYGGLQVFLNIIRTETAVVPNISPIG